jgi:hypothetical protein
MSETAHVFQLASTSTRHDHEADTRLEGGRLPLTARLALGPRCFRHSCVDRDVPSSNTLIKLPLAEPRLLEYSICLILVSSLSLFSLLSIETNVFTKKNNFTYFGWINACPYAYTL